MRFIILFMLIASLTQSSDCWIFNNINYRVLIAKQIQKEVINRQLVSELGPVEMARLKFNLIFPGTKWCGAGNIADNFDDLGTAVEADKCCRAHDTCGGIIEAGETKHNLTNEAFYSRLSCPCDETFRLCLLKDGSDTSNTIGLMYFNIIGTQCYREDYNATGCKTYGGWLNTKCIEYEYDTSSTKFYQWFDVPNYN